MTRRLTILTTILLLFALTAFGANRRFTLVIDAGHGGHDTGALGSFSREKDINLSVALAFGRMVEFNCPDVRVVYTRKTDVFVPLHTRANIANKNNADLFMSIHTNAVRPGASAKGFSVYTLGMHRQKDNLDVAMRENSVISMESDYKQTYQGFDPNSAESYIMFEFIQSANMEKSVELAKMVQRHVLSTADCFNMGVHQAGFLVLRETSMPSCLIELGFITDADEERFLNSDDGQQRYAKGIFEAFLQYKDKYGGGVSKAQAATIKGETKPLARATPAKVVVPKIQVNTPPAKPLRPVKNDEKKRNNRDEKADNTSASNDALPVFKVQIFAINRQLRPGSEQFKGHDDVDSYTDNGMVKYTIGSSTDYAKIMRLRKKLRKDFPNCFVVAFRNGKKMNTPLAINEYVKRLKSEK